MNKYRDLCPPDARPALEFDLPQLAYPARLNAVRTVLEGALEADWGERPAFYAAGRTFTFADVRREVHRRGAALRSLGVSAGDTVILRLPDGFELVAVLLAVQAIGAVAMPTYVQLRADDLVYRADDTDAGFLIVDAALLDEAAPVPQARNGETEVVALPRDAAGRYRAFADSLPAGEVEPAYADTDAEALCLFLYTSGSTGAPKGTCHCHRDSTLR